MKEGTDNKKATTETSYDLNGRIIKEIDKLGRIATYKYDDMGRVVSKTLTYGDETRTTTTSYGYVDNFYVVTGTGSNKRLPSVEVVEEKNANNEVIAKTYTDSYGQIVREERDGICKDYTYDKQGNVFTTYSRGAQDVNTVSPKLVVTLYDKNGRLTDTIQNPVYRNGSFTVDVTKSIVMTNKYDARGNLVEETDGKGNKTIYEYNEEDKHSNPIKIAKLTPIQMPHVDINELKEGRKAFTKEEWMDVLLRSIGMEPDQLSEREKWLLLLRLVPLVENNYNLCELGPRSTGKSHIYKEISPNSILVSGGQTTVANLFYNMGKRTVGLVGLWDCVAFDEVAGIKFKDKDGIQIMKDYMASGSFARGKEEKAATASMVFVGNINQSVDVLLKTSSLFAPFPQEMGTDTAFLDRMHCYLPGWEIPKFRPEHFTDDYGFISDYLAEFIRELRKEQYGDALDHYFRLGRNLNQRDTIAVRRMIDGYLKLMYPNGEFTKKNWKNYSDCIGNASPCQGAIEEAGWYGVL